MDIANAARCAYALAICLYTSAARGDASAAQVLLCPSEGLRFLEYFLRLFVRPDPTFRSHQSVCRCGPLAQPHR